VFVKVTINTLYHPIASFFHLFNKPIWARVHSSTCINFFCYRIWNYTLLISIFQSFHLIFVIKGARTVGHLTWGFLLILPRNLKTTNMRVGLPLPHDFRQDLGDVFVVFFFFLLVFSLLFPTVPASPLSPSSLQCCWFLFTL
jgi:hypothetical protein